MGMHCPRPEDPYTGDCAALSPSPYLLHDQLTTHASTGSHTRNNERLVVTHYADIYGITVLPSLLYPVTLLRGILCCIPRRRPPILLCEP